MAKSLKDDDAKLEGLRSHRLRQPVPEHETLSIYVSNRKEICSEKSDLQGKILLSQLSIQQESCIIGGLSLRKAKSRNQIQNELS